MERKLGEDGRGRRRSSVEKRVYREKESNLFF